MGGIMTDEREWVRAEVLWDGGADREDERDVWDRDEGTGVSYPARWVTPRAQQDDGAHLSKRKRKKLRGSERGDGA